MATNGSPAWQDGAWAANSFTDGSWGTPTSVPSDQGRWKVCKHPLYSILQTILKRAFPDE